MPPGYAASSFPARPSAPGRVRELQHGLGAESQIRGPRPCQLRCPFEDQRRPDALAVQRRRPFEVGDDDGHIAEALDAQRVRTGLPALCPTWLEPRILERPGALRVAVDGLGLEELELGDRVFGVGVDVAFFGRWVREPPGLQDPNAVARQPVPLLADVVAEPGDRVAVPAEPGLEATDGHGCGLGLGARRHRLDDGVADHQERPHAALAFAVLAVHDAAHRSEDPVVPVIERGQILGDVGHVEQLADSHNCLPLIVCVPLVTSALPCIGPACIGPWPASALVAGARVIPTPLRSVPRVRWRVR